MKKRLDIPGLRGALIKKIRGDRTQLSLSQLLGFSYNQVYRWESGRSGISWRQFVVLCEVGGADLKHAVRSFAFFQSNLEAASIINHIGGNIGPADIAGHTFSSEATVRNYMTSRTEPPLDFMLSMFRYCTPYLQVFLNYLTNDSFNDYFHSEGVDQKESRLNGGTPLTALVVRSLELKQYTQLPMHLPGIIANILSISVVEEEACLRALEAAGAIKWKDCKWVPTNQSLPTFMEREAGRSVLEYCLNAAQVRFQVGPRPDRDMFGYMVLSVSATALAEIQQRYFQFYRDVSDIVVNDPLSSESVHIMNFQFFDVSHQTAEDVDLKALQ